jgi:DNA polymerase-3 subunit gamma/tau
MSQTLYQKYRPQSFKDVVSQNHIKITLQNEIETGKTAHAYLFYGPRGIGKTTMARLLAKALNCENRKEKESEPCNKCSSCLEITAGRSIDVIEMDAASQTGVDNVRENIIQNARFSPSKSKYKVFIIDEVHMLSPAAFNALLKIIEEPPKHVIFILATTEIHKVPATIISRCQRFDYKRAGLEDIVTSLSLIMQQEGIKIAKEVLENIARHSEGSIRDAQSLLGQVLALGEKDITAAQAELIIPKSNFDLVADFVEYLVHKNTEGGISLINKIIEEGVDLNQFCVDLIEFLRKMLLYKISGGLKGFSFELDENIEKKISQLQKEWEVRKITSVIEIFILKKQELKYSSIIQLPLELAVVEICADQTINPTGFTAGDEKKTWQELKSKVLGKIAGGQAMPAPDMEKKNENIPAEASIAPESGINLKQIEDNWLKVLEKIDETNHSLIFVLTMAKPLSINKNVLELGFKHKFHKEIIEIRKNKFTLENVIEEIIKTKIVTTFKVVPDLVVESTIKKPVVESAGVNGSLTDILDAFGGRVVE